MDGTALIDLAPLLRLAALALVLAAAAAGLGLAAPPRRATPAPRLRALTALTLFLTFDLVLFGAFTRLTDSGLGCPDWPGCYGNASPLGAQRRHRRRAGALPTGPVTHGKAWIEMVHRYLAIGGRRADHRARWRPGLARAPRAAATRRGGRSRRCVWVCLQGAFGALTVTMKLYPAIVTLHLLGGLVLLALLALQPSRYRAAPLALPRRRCARRLARCWRCWLLQVALGGWVSTNYAVLACSDFPDLPGQWWPPMDFAQGFALRASSARGSGGGYLPFAALTAIHMAHRLGALRGAARRWRCWRWRLLRRGERGAAPLRRSRWSALALWQLASGLSQRGARLAAGRRAWRTRPAPRRWSLLLTLLLARALGARRRAVPSGRRRRVRPPPENRAPHGRHRSPRSAARAAPRSRCAQYYALTKPRVVQLIVFCAVIGMLLAVPGLPDWRDRARRHRRHLAGGRAPRRPSTAWSSSASTQDGAHRVAADRHAAS